MVRLGLISGPTRSFYFRELKGVVTHCLRHRIIGPLRAFVRNWIRKGAPIDPAFLLLPRRSMTITLHQLCVALNLEPFVADAKMWLTHPECRVPASVIAKAKVKPRPYDLYFVPHNLLLHAPEGTCYAEFNRRGLVLSYVDEADASTRELEASMGNLDRLLQAS